MDVLNTIIPQGYDICKVDTNLEDAFTWLMKDFNENAN